MDTQTILILVALFSGLGFGLILLYYIMGSNAQDNMRSLMGNAGAAGAAPGSVMGGAGKQVSEEELRAIKQKTKKSKKRKIEPSMEERFLHAGMYTEQEHKDFRRMQFLFPILTTPILGLGISFMSADLALPAAIIGFLVGYRLPVALLDKKIARRGEEILYYLPLVIEQIAIGVSSSLDVGPCVMNIVDMADERDTHNVVTELLRTVIYHVRSGVSLEDALTEVGINSGHLELKHSFMSLGQVVKHGGEITRQLQELADSVAQQRETQIEEVIKKLEVKATGPVSVVFFGFMIILMSGFVVKLSGAI